MTSTPAFQFKGVGLFEVQNVIAVRWSEDGESLYFAELVNETSPSYLDWFEYDLASDSIRSAPSPLNYDAGIWERLGVAEPRIASNIFPELIGNISPSGKYILYPIYSGDPDPFSGGPFSFDIWLANLHSQYKYKLAESGWALLTRAAWFSDESKVLFELMAYEGGLGKLILAEVKTGIKQYVAIPSGEYWQLSPDDTTLAVITPDEAGYNSLVEYSLAEETWKVIDADVWPYAPFAWSRNGQLLFYWADPTHEGEARLLRVYDQVSGKTNDLISHATLVAEIGATSAGALSVSPDGRRIAIFDGALWVIILP